jgi:cytochrome c biogenesis protein CcmG/thiol:disulfide interchange protein DsbE
MSWKKILIPGAALPIVALLGYGLTRDPNTVESPLPGREAFEFRAATLNGDTLALSDLAGKVVVLNFYASWCVACIEEHIVFVEADHRYSADEFQMLGVVYQDSPENARRWMSEMGGTWPSLVDTNSRIAIDYGVYGVPETYFIDRQGRIAYKQIGPVSWPLMRAKVDSLLAVPAGAELTATEGEIPAGRSAGHERAAPGGEPRGSGSAP